MAFSSKHTAESRAKMSKAHLGKRQCPETCLKISQARRKQPPPNLKDGIYSKKSLEKNLQETYIKRMSALLELSEDQISDYIEPLKLNQTFLNLGLFINSILDNKRKSWLSFSLIQKQQETGKHPLEWFIQAQKDMNLDLDFSLLQIQRKQEEIVSDHEESLKGTDEMKQIKYLRQVRKLERIFVDATRPLNGNQEVHLLGEYGSVIQNKNFKTLLKLKVVLDALGLKKEIDKRQYIKGVIADKRRKNGCNFVPIKTMASPLCILDFLFYLKENWYERHAYTPGTNKDDTRELEYGRDYYEDRAGITCGYLADLIHMCRNSQLSSELSNLMEREEVVWYIMQSPVLKAFRHLIRKVRPDIYKRVIKIKKELQTDDRLKEILHRIKLDAEERWHIGKFPVFGDVEKDKRAIKFAFVEKPKILREALEIYEGLRS